MQYTFCTRLKQCLRRASSYDLDILPVDLQSMQYKTVNKKTLTLSRATYNHFKHQQETLHKQKRLITWCPLHDELFQIPDQASGHGKSTFVMFLISHDLLHISIPIIMHFIFLPYSFTPIQNLKSCEKMRHLNVDTLGLMPKRNRLKVPTLQSPFCLLSM